MLQIVRPSVTSLQCRRYTNISPTYYRRFIIPSKNIRNVERGNSFNNIIIKNSQARKFSFNKPISLPIRQSSMFVEPSWYVLVTLGIFGIVSAMFAAVENEAESQTNEEEKPLAEVAIDTPIEHKSHVHEVSPPTEDLPDEIAELTFAPNVPPPIQRNYPVNLKVNMNVKVVNDLLGNCRP
jgi:hypothetical protein